jgi:hypothetical protein
MQKSSSEDASFLSALEFMISQQQQNSHGLQNQGVPNSIANQNMNPSMAVSPNAIGQPNAMAQPGMMGLKPPGNSFMQNRIMQQPPTQQFNVNSRMQNPMAQDPESLKALFANPQAQQSSFSGQKQAMSIQMQQQQVAAMRQIMQQQQKQKQMQNVQNIQNSGADPSIQQALGALLMNANAPNHHGQQLATDANRAVQDNNMDWRMSMTHQERIQFIIRL